MPEVRNPGLATVSTDGVTITGAGTPASPVALLAVQHDATLSGAGTVASPLSAAQQTPTGWPLTFFMHGYGGALASFTVVTANKIELIGMYLPCSVQFSSLIFGVGTADAVNLSDIGIYTYAGVLAAHIGAQVLSSATIQAVAIAGGGTVTLPPGRYFWAATSNGSTIAFRDDTAGFTYTFQRATAFGTSSGGNLPNSITPPADAPNNANGALLGFTT
jgi:hypothetical protein